MHTFLSQLAARWHRLACRFEEARRLRRAMHQLGQMSAHELRDIGFTHPAIARAAAADMPSRCA